MPQGSQTCEVPEEPTFSGLGLELKVEDLGSGILPEKRISNGK